MVQSLILRVIKSPSHISDCTKCLEVSDEDNRVLGVQTTITEDMEPDTMDLVSVQIKEAIRQR